jgi:hypothetical protein
VASPGQTNYHARDLSWQASSFGALGTTAVQNVKKYLNSISRKWGNAASTNPWVVVNSTTPNYTDNATSYVDTQQLPNGELFTYRERVTYDDGAVSHFTKLVTITADNDWPTAVADPPSSNPTLYTTARNRTLRITNPAQGVLANDSDVDSPDYVDSGSLTFMHAVLVTGPRTLAGVSSGTLTLNDNGTFTFAPAGGFIGVIQFTYRATNGNWSVNTSIPMNSQSEIDNAPPATVTITVMP